MLITVEKKTEKMKSSGRREDVEAGVISLHRLRGPQIVDRVTCIRRPFISVASMGTMLYTKQLAQARQNAAAGSHKGNCFIVE